MLRRPSEYESPSCATVGGDLWFPDALIGGISVADGIIAKSICSSCPHKSECANWGINNELYGIWGGLGHRERIKIRNARGIRMRGELKLA